MAVPEELLVHLRRARDLADRHYAEPLDLDRLAGEAGVSKWHFLRCFSETYDRTPAAYVAERRIERAQDLLRATNLTVTEVCMLVGYSSLGSFSTKFRQLVGMSPSAYQAKFAETGRGSDPGVLRVHVGTKRPCCKFRNSGEAISAMLRRRFDHMISNISLFTLYVTDHDEAKRFYTEVLGFEERADVRMGDAFRWVTVGHPTQPELEVTLMLPGPAARRGHGRLPSAVRSRRVRWAASAWRPTTVTPRTRS